MRRGLQVALAAAPGLRHFEAVLFTRIKECRQAQAPASVPSKQRRRRRGGRKHRKAPETLVLILDTTNVNPAPQSTQPRPDQLVGFDPFRLQCGQSNPLRPWVETES